MSCVFRTIRGIFWTAEEQGLLGAQTYYNSHKNLSEKFYFVSEVKIYLIVFNLFFLKTDQGAFRPQTDNSHLTFMGSEKHVINFLYSNFSLFKEKTFG